MDSVFKLFLQNDVLGGLTNYLTPSSHQLHVTNPDG